MNPRHGAPKPAAPAACSRASSAPNPNAADGVARPGGIIEMTSAVPVTASTSGTGTASASASQRRPLASAANAAPISAGDACSSDGHLGERALPASQGDHQVLIAVLGADDARLAHGQAGLPRDPARDGCVHPAVLSRRASRGDDRRGRAEQVEHPAELVRAAAPRIGDVPCPVIGQHAYLAEQPDPGGVLALSPGHSPKVREVPRVHGEDQVIPG